MDNEYFRTRLLNLTALVQQYCMTVENVRESSKEDFINIILVLLPKIYVEFLDISPDNGNVVDVDFYFKSYIEEDYYDSIRRGIESVMGADDIFLETFEEDMKYSDTPISASISESLADIFQPLYNFLSEVKESGGDTLTEAYLQCKEDFDSYWSQTLCNVLRALNALR